MMIAMMIPSASLMILLFAAINRKQPIKGTPIVSTNVFALGHIIVWGGFSLLATALLWRQERVGRVSTLDCHQWSDRLATPAETADESSDPEQRAQVAFLETLASEYEQFFGKSGHQVAAVHSFGQLPLTVIGATEPEPGFGESAQAFRQFWNDESESLAGLSEEGRFMLEIWRSFSASWSL